MKLDLQEILIEYSKNKENFNPEIFFKDFNDKFKKSEEAYLIGLEAYNKNLLDLSEKFFEFSMDILENLDKKLELSYLLHSLASLKSKKDLNEARKLFEKSLSIKKSLNDNIGITLLLIDLAYLEEITNNIQKAIDLNKECIFYLLKENLINDIFKILVKLSDLDPQNNKNYLVQALYISLNNNIDIEDIIILISKFIKTFGIEDDNIPLLISTLSLIYKAKNLINEEINKTLIELISSCAVVRDIENISKWIKYEKFDDIQVSLKRLEIFINNLVTENYISSYVENNIRDNK